MSSNTHLNKPKILAKGALFSTFDATELETFAQFATVHQVDDGMVVCSQGSDGDAMYLIVHGQVQVSLIAKDRKVIVGTLGQGDTFGEISLLDGGKRTATV